MTPGTYYLLGVLTVPAVALLGVVSLLIWVRVSLALSGRGWFIEVNLFNPERWPSDWALRQDIWVERQCGPIFYGHWARDTPLKVNRWVGIGKSRGRGIYVGKEVVR